jgi:hypothetical protein
MGGTPSGTNSMQRSCMGIERRIPDSMLVTTEHVRGVAALVDQVRLGDQDADDLVDRGQDHQHQPDHAPSRRNGRQVVGQLPAIEQIVTVLTKVIGDAPKTTPTQPMRPALPHPRAAFAAR